MLAADNISGVCQSLMRSVVSSGVVRSEDADLACRIMREELKAFLFGEKYADERALTLIGNESLAFASITAECVRRIVSERS